MNLHKKIYVLLLVVTLISVLSTGCGKLSESRPLVASPTELDIPFDVDNAMAGTTATGSINVLSYQINFTWWRSVMNTTPTPTFTYGFRNSSPDFKTLSTLAPDNSSIILNIPLASISTLNSISYYNHDADWLTGGFGSYVDQMYVYSVRDNGTEHYLGEGVVRDTLTDKKLRTLIIPTLNREATTKIRLKFQQGGNHFPVIGCAYFQLVSFNADILIDPPQPTPNLAPLLLFNHLGSLTEIANSVTGNNGAAVGSLLFKPCALGNGVAPAPRTGDHNLINNYVKFSKVRLLNKGSLEFWYTPSWTSGTIGHVVDVACFSVPKVGGLPAGMAINYNDWQDRFCVTIYDSSRSNYICRKFIPSSLNSWVVGKPLHFAVSWDYAAPLDDNKLVIYVNGLKQGSIESINGNTSTAIKEMNATGTLMLGSRDTNGDWDRHNWEGMDGIMDELKAWNYAKSDYPIIAPPTPNTTLIFWNKLGSNSQVKTSALGTAGEIIGTLNYSPAKFANGVSPAPRTGNLDLINNYARYKLTKLPAKGTIEFWYTPTWKSSGSIGQVVDLVTLGEPGNNNNVALYIQYNDWQDKFGITCQNPGASSLINCRFRPNDLPGWQVGKPIHLAFTWDSTITAVSSMVKIYADGVPVGSVETSWGTPSTLLSNFTCTNGYLHLGSRSYWATGEWSRHHFTGMAGVMDNLKIYDGAKTDFSDRFTE